MNQIPEVPEWAPYMTEDRTMGEVATLTSNNAQAFSLTPKSLDEAMQYADVIAKSDIVPSEYKGKPGNVLVAIQMGLELGLPPLQALQNIAVINGRPCVWGDSLMAIARAHPACEYINETFDDKTMTATCRVKRRGEPEQSRTFSRGEAEQAGLTGKGPWKQYEKRMLQMRARGFAIRDVFPDALRGIALAEEVRDYPERDVTPSPSRPTEPEHLPEYPEDRFEDNLPKWREAIESDKRSADDIIRMVSSSYQLTEDQQKRVKDIENTEEQ